MTKAYAYLRVSGKGQIDGDGFPRQWEAINAFARGRDIKIVRVFREEGVGGAKELEDRPALIELIEALHSNGVKLVLIEKLDRLARDLMVQESIIGDLHKSGFELISALEPDLLENDPSRKLMRQIFGAIAEYDKCMIVLKLRAARQRTKAKYGRCEGRKPYGFYPGEAEIVKCMQVWRADGLSDHHIACQLNKTKIPPRHGAQWWARTVSNILDRETTREAA